MKGDEEKVEKKKRNSNVVEATRLNRKKSEEKFELVSGNSTNNMNMGNDVKCAGDICKLP